MKFSEVKIDKRHLFSLWIKKNGNDSTKKRHILEYIMQICNIDCNAFSDFAANVKRKVIVMCNYLKKIWEKHNRTESKVLARHVEYFKKPFKIINNTTSIAGRKKIPFNECCIATQRKKTANIRNSYQLNELAFATQLKLRESGQNDTAAIFEEATQTTPSRGFKIRDSWRKAKKNPTCNYTDLQALALMIDTDLSVSQYKKIRSQANIRNANIYPPYHRILAEKKRCDPDDEFITVTEREAEVKLQQLLDITSKRIVEAYAKNLDCFSDKELLNIKMIIKYGMDGSTGNHEYNLAFKQDDGSESDASIFMSSLVPIRAECNGKILFENPRPSSTRLCRPIRFQVAKETSELAIREKDYLDRQISVLKPTKTVKNGRNICIYYNMLLTMVDGKICSALTETKSSARCYICKAKPTDMNNIDKVKAFRVDKSNYQFGLSTLHAWIRFLEYFLKLAYRLDIMKWSPRGEDRKNMLERKIVIQTRLKIELGLNIDKPCPGGSGNSNTGNVARRFFRNAEKVAEITGLDLDLIRRCSSILQVLASGRRVKTSAFGAYCLDTTHLCVKLYPWYHLPASVHKVLMHGSAVMEHFIIPIGQLSEEAQEAKNKEWKRYREHHTGKFSREIINRDLLNWLLLSSDPLITSVRGWSQKPVKSLSSDAKTLLVDENTTDDEVDSEDEE